MTLGEVGGFPYRHSLIFVEFNQFGPRNLAGAGTAAQNSVVATTAVQNSAGAAAKALSATAAWKLPSHVPSFEDDGT